VLLVTFGILAGAGCSRYNVLLTLFGLLLSLGLPSTTPIRRGRERRADHDEDRGDITPREATIKSMDQ